MRVGRVNRKACGRIPAADHPTKGSAMLTLTPSAVQAVDALLHSPQVPDDAGLRIAATDDAQLSVGIATQPEPGDQVIEESGARVFVDENAAPLVDDAQLEAHAQGDQIAFGLTPKNGDAPATDAQA
jgi:Fe-S cluster assembly iron-binding protein IscA